jgi:alkanesulfonate monooxygenase SsuD/methylene tetrahydromethanopterin reductase-like flavin-dependent oxidoreductase (luciferase family)
VGDLSGFGDIYGATKLKCSNIFDPAAEHIWAGGATVIIDYEFNTMGQLPSAGVIEAAIIAEERGIGGAWAGDSNVRDPTILLTGIAARTTKFTVGTSVLSIFARSPVATGCLAATLDDMSNGRFILGLGISNKLLASWYGSEWDAPIGRMKEYIEIVRKVFRKEKLEYHGKRYYSTGNFKLAFEPPNRDLRIYMAALGPQMSKLAGSISEGVLINQADPEQVGVIGDLAKQGACEAGKDPFLLDVVFQLRCAVNKDIQLARTFLKKVLAYYGLADHYKDMYARMGFGREAEALREAYLNKGFSEAVKSIPDAMLDRLPAVAATSFKEAKEKIELRLKDYEKYGATRVHLALVPTTEFAVQETKDFFLSW